MSSSIKAIVFDFDGVILESADIKTLAFVELYASHGSAVVEQVRAHHLANLGVSRFKKFEWVAANVLGKPIDEAGSKALGKQFSELALAKVLACPFVPGAEQALGRLAGTIPMFVASGTPHGELQLIVEKRGLASTFVEVHGSPAEKPNIVRDIMQRHRFTAREILFVGDGTGDHEAAAELGTEFLARDTPDLHDHWVRLGVRREPDLKRFAELVAAW